MDIVVVGKPKAALRAYHPRFVALEQSQIHVSKRADANLSLEIASDRCAELMRYEGLCGFLVPKSETVAWMYAVRGKEELHCTIATIFSTPRASQRFQFAV